MQPYISPSAHVHPTAKLHPGVWIGPNVEIGAGAVIGHYAVIGGMPEHRDFFDDTEMVRSKGVIIGAGARIFEYVTVHAGTRRPTLIAERVAVFNHSHIAHDCMIEAGSIIGGQVSLAGHVHVMPAAQVSGKSCVVQFAVIGAYAFVGGFTFVTRHIPPGEKWLGFPARFVSANDIGLQRAGMPLEECLSRYGQRFNELTSEVSL